MAPPSWEALATPEEGCRKCREKTGGNVGPEWNFRFFWGLQNVIPSMKMWEISWKYHDENEVLVRKLGFSWGKSSMKSEI